MKKSLLALSVIAFAASANAATVYEKDGTSLTIDGRVQSVFYNGNHRKAGEKDSSIENSSRFGIGGKTQITDWVAGTGYAQWDMNSTGNADGTVKARDQYVGADFGEFGLVRAGRFLDSTYSVEAATDIYEDAAGNVQGKHNSERRGGQLQYTFNNYGFFAQAGVQTAQDNAKLVDSEYFFKNDKYAINSGFNGALGYTIDDVVFGPLSFKAGYSYVKGQSTNDLGTVSDADNSFYSNGTAFNNFKHANASIAWGNVNSGFYVAALYEHAALRTNDDKKIVNDGFELAAGYAFDNGVSVVAGYETSYYHKKNLTTGDKENKAIVRRIPVFVNYAIKENFNIWTECGFNAGSSASAKDEDISSSARETLFSVGARYTF